MSGAKTPPKAAELTACARTIEVPADRTRVQLFPYGTWFGRDGRGPYQLVDRAHAAAVIATTKRQQGGTDLAFDYDHAMVPGVAAAGEQVASGWFSADDLVADETGLWATNVRWTDAASAKLDAKEYRYASPYFGFEKGTGRITRIINAALVNRPNFDLAAVAAELPHEENDTMSFAKIAAALGLAATASEDDVVASIGTMKTQLSATASALGLAATATGEELATAAATLKDAADPRKVVPIAALQDLQAQVATLNEGRAAAAVDAAISEGKLTPALRDWGIKRFVADETDFAAYIASAPVLIEPGRQAPAKVDPSSDVLTDEEKAAAAAIGIPEADFLASRKEMAA